MTAKRSYHTLCFKDQSSIESWNLSANGANRELIERLLLDDEELGFVVDEGPHAKWPERVVVLDNEVGWSKHL